MARNEGRPMRRKAERGHRSGERKKAKERESSSRWRSEGCGEEKRREEKRRERGGGGGGGGRENEGNEEGWTDSVAAVVNTVEEGRRQNYRGEGEIRKRGERHRDREGDGARVRVARSERGKGERGRGT